jgi:hypothetical protein
MFATKMFIPYPLSYFTFVNYINALEIVQKQVPFGMNQFKKFNFKKLFNSK